MGLGFFSFFPLSDMFYNLAFVSILRYNAEQILNICSSVVFDIQIITLYLRIWFLWFVYCRTSFNYIIFWVQTLSFSDTYGDLPWRLIGCISKLSVTLSRYRSILQKMIFFLMLTTWMFLPFPGVLQYSKVFTIG